MIKKAFLIAIFLTIPVMTFMTYALHWVRNYVQAMWGVEIGPIVYNALLSLSFAFAIWITAGKFLKELKTISEKKRGEFDA